MKDRHLATNEDIYKAITNLQSDVISEGAKLKSKMADLKLDVALLNSSIISIEKTTNSNSYAINGNGTPGIKSRLQRVEDSENRREWWAKVSLGSAIGAVITAVGSFFLRSFYD